MREHLELHIRIKNPFHELLQKDNSVTIHQQNLQVLATDVFKAKNDLSPKIMIRKYTHKEITLYVETLKLPTTVFGQSNV